MNTILQKILEHIINKMLKHQNEFTDLFLGEINTNYKNALNEAKESKKGIYFCGWYFFVIKNNKATFHIAKCAK